MLNYLPYIQKFMAWVTFRKVAMLALGASVWIFSLTLFENRHEIWGPKDNNLPRPLEHVRLKVKEKLTTRMKTLLDSNSLLNYISVTSANIRLNEADIVYWYSRDPVINFELGDKFAKNGTVHQLFNSDDNYNASVVRTINSEFACYENKGLLGQNLSTRIPYICRISIPPHYGQFTGYITIGVTAKPTQSQMDDMRRALADIASNLFFDNISR